jgi:thiamine transport system substrate-binding protein
MEDMLKPEYKSLLVVENPATSSPGLAFLLATIGHFGQDGYRDYWRGLVQNDVLVVNDWESAYNREFTRRGGARPVVVSYSSSPPFEVLDSAQAGKEPPTAAVTGGDSCFRQIEFVGILKGTAHEKAAKQLVDFMLSERFQRDMPLQMFVFPARDGTKLPPAFVKYAKVAPRPFTLPPEEIARNRDQWIDQWTSTVLR